MQTRGDKSHAIHFHFCLSRAAVLLSLLKTDNGKHFGLPHSSSDVFSCNVHRSTPRQPYQFLASRNVRLTFFFFTGFFNDPSSPYPASAMYKSAPKVPHWQRESSPSYRQSPLSRRYRIFMLFAILLVLWYRHSKSEISKESKENNRFENPTLLSQCSGKLRVTSSF